MPLGFSTFASGLRRTNMQPEAEGNLFMQLLHAGHFLRDLRYRLRYGELSRAPLRLLRFQIMTDVVDCDWMARSHDRWDMSPSRKVQQRQASLQALRDALDIRALLFEAFPRSEVVNARAFRETADYKRELIVCGCLYNNDNTARGVNSVVVRAKNLGFRFRMEDDVLQAIEPEGY